MRVVKLAVSGAGQLLDSFCFARKPERKGVTPGLALIWDRIEIIMLAGGSNLVSNIKVSMSVSQDVIPFKHREQQNRSGFGTAGETACPTYYR